MEQLELLTAWRDPLIRTGQVLLIIFLAWVAQRILTRAISRLGDRYSLLPPEVLQPLRGLVRWLIMGSALLMVPGVPCVSAGRTPAASPCWPVAAITLVMAI